MAEKLKGPGLTKEKFLGLVAELRKADAAKDKAVGECRAVRKRMKASGVDLDAYALMQNLAKLEPDDAEVRIKNLRRYMAWDGTGEQLALFGDSVDFGDEPLPVDDEFIDATRDQAVAFALEREAADAADSEPVAVPPAVKKASTRRALAEPVH